MSARFCRCCCKRTDHDKIVDIHGTGARSGVIERLFFFAVSMAASEVMASRYLECQECGRITRQ